LREIRRERSIGLKERIRI